MHQAIGSPDKPTKNLSNTLVSQANTQNGRFLSQYPNHLL
jgi:hypothetical protein